MLYKAAVHADSARIFTHCYIVYYNKVSDTQVRNIVLPKLTVITNLSTSNTSTAATIAPLSGKMVTGILITGIPFASIQIQASG